MTMLAANREPSVVAGKKASFAETFTAAEMHQGIGAEDEVEDGRRAQAGFVAYSEGAS